MATKKKMLQAAAGQAGGAGGAVLNVEDVFSTYLYEGNGDGSAATNVQTINNGIDLSGEGGMVWIKGRSHTTDHIINDTVRGAGNTLQPNLTDANQTGYYDISQFNSDGFGLDAGGNVNANGGDYTSWTFRKAPKFFTMVQWSGNSTMGRTISHDLGTDVGFILIKAVDKADAWYALHKDSNMLVLNQTTAEYSDATTADYFGDGTNIVRPTSTEFTIGSDAGINGTGYNYIAYLFAHNDGDGDFGPDGDADIIKCGSWTGSGSSGTQVELGFEPQWVMVKQASGTSGSGWMLFDAMRGMSVDQNKRLLPNSSDAEDDYQAGNVPVSTNATGFKVNSSFFYDSGRTFIYMAIRRGTKVPESATEVFDVDAYSGNSTAGRIIPSAFPVDLAIVQSRSAAGDTNAVADRLRGANVLLNTPNNHAELTNNTDSITGFDFMDGIEIGADTRTNWSSGTYVSWMWKRAPGYFDAVAYKGSTSIQNISHNLGVQPEMIWIKNRDWSGTSWTVLFTSLGARKYLSLDTADGAVSLPLYNGTDFFANTLPTSSVFTVGGGTAGGGYDNVGSSGLNYIAYLFASLDGISKVGSYTGTGATLNIDCGFTSGARFVLLKRTDSAQEWRVFDTARGIVAGNDPLLNLNSTGAEEAFDDLIDPYSAGFSLTSSGMVNANNGEYIFYAIA